MMRFGDFVAKVEYDSDIGMFHGFVVNVPSEITFYGGSVGELEKEFETSIKTYLDVCAERGIEPHKPYSGKFNVRLTPDLHARAVRAANVTGQSLNAWMVDAVTTKAEQETDG
jgi:predicted HicB family RNase H-like nuclease